MASYQESAVKINTLLKEGFITNDKNKIIDGMLWFGQVAKFRCRNNSAYDNFAKLCLEGIVEIERTPLRLGEMESGPGEKEFEVLRVRK